MWNVSSATMPEKCWASHPNVTHSSPPESEDDPGLSGLT